MELQALKLFVSEDTVNGLIKKYVPDTGSIENLRIRLTPEGVVIAGDYPTFLMKMAFETLWELTAAGPELLARLTSVRVAGLPAGLLKGALLKLLRDAVTGQPGIQILDEAVRIHAEQVAGAHGVPLRVRFTGLRCSIAGLVLEAGT
jgi:hypothetical protein